MDMDLRIFIREELNRLFNPEDVNKLGDEISPPVGEINPRLKFRVTCLQGEGEKFVDLSKDFESEWAASGYMKQLKSEDPSLAPMVGPVHKNG